MTCTCSKRVVEVQVAGIQGAKGDKGDTGATPEITALAESLAYTEDASVTQSGTVEQPVLTFGIPRGVPGDSAEIETISTSYIANLFGE